MLLLSPLINIVENEPCYLILVRLPVLVITLHLFFAHLRNDVLRSSRIFTQELFGIWVVNLEEQTPDVVLEIGCRLLVTTLLAYVGERLSPLEMSALNAINA